MPVGIIFWAYAHLIIKIWPGSTAVLHMSRTKMTVWVDSNNWERLFESNVELNSVEPKLLHQINNKSGLVGQWLFKTKSKWRHFSRIHVWFDSCENCRFDPKSVCRRQAWRTPQPSQMKSAEINWVKRWTSHEPNKLNWVWLTWSTAFDPGLRWEFDHGSTLNCFCCFCCPFLYRQRMIDTIRAHMTQVAPATAAAMVVVLDLPPLRPVDPLRPVKSKGEKTEKK